MLPSSIRATLFDRISDQTMRYVEAVPTGEATALTADVYEMVAEDLFINGSITCHSPVPELMAGMWCGGRESVLVEDHIDRATKEAMCNVLSEFNDCHYCEDMTVSLVSAAGRGDLISWGGASTANGEPTADEPILQWTEAVANGDWDASFPLGTDAFPEAVGVAVAFSYIPRVSHVLMDGSPLEAPLGARTLRRIALRFFVHELRLSLDETLEPGQAIELLPAPETPVDLLWAARNPRIEAAFSRWIAAVERHADRAFPEPIRTFVAGRVADWNGEPPPMSPSWVDDEVRDLDPDHRYLARFALLVALAPYQVDESIVRPVLDDGDQAHFVRSLTWAAMTGALRMANGIASANQELLVEEANMVETRLA